MKKNKTCLNYFDQNKDLLSKYELLSFKIFEAELNWHSFIIALFSKGVG
jgi:hypothetical protein